MTEDESWTSCVGRGWRPLVQLLLDAAKRRKLKVTQVKEKFGGLRFYYDPTKETPTNNLDYSDGYMDGLADASYCICEECGTTQHVTTEGKGWTLTLCHDCRVEIARERARSFSLASAGKEDLEVLKQAQAGGKKK